MQIRQLLNNATKKLKRVSSSAELDAEILMIITLRSTHLKQRTVLEAKSVVNKSWLYSHPGYKLSKSQIQKFNTLLSRRLKGEPIAYITGHKEFYGLDFLVDRSVLIPRPETELMVELVIKYIGNKKLNVIDVGAGSGCIAISIAKNCPRVKVYASDISKKALVVARKNASYHKVTSKINFKVGKGIPFSKIKFDVVCANLPYLRPDQIKGNLIYEPRQALFGGKDGTLAYRKFFKNLNIFLAKRYLIVIEIDPGQVLKLKRIINASTLLSIDTEQVECVKKNLNNPSIKIVKDYSGKNRFLQITTSFPKSL